MGNCINQDENNNNLDKGSVTVKSKSIISYNENIKTYKDDKQNVKKIFDYKQSKKNNNSQHNVSMKDFKLIKMLGKGSFGTVVLVQKMIGSKKKEGKFYAMKILVKEQLVLNNLEKSVVMERKIITQLHDHPFIVNLYYAFQTEKKLYMVMDFLQGGEFFNLLYRRKMLSEEEAKFYMAEVLLGLEGLHSNQIIYRDLKPENILLSNDGHIKLVDFGLSKNGMKKNTKTFSFVGTPEYLSPEILLRKGHDFSVDFWSFGVVLYEIIGGRSPFYDKNRQQMFQNIQKCQFVYKDWFSKEARSIIDLLLELDPKKRLTDIQKIKKHAFFSDINFSELYCKKISAPYIPKIQNSLDLNNFDKVFTNQPYQDTPNNNNLKGTIQNGYSQFTYINKQMESTIISQLNQTHIKESDMSIIVEKSL